MGIPVKCKACPYLEFDEKSEEDDHWGYCDHISRKGLERLWLSSDTGDNPPPPECPLRGHPEKPAFETGYTAIEFKSAQNVKGVGVEAVYTCEHGTKGPNGTTLAFDMIILVCPTCSKVRVEFNPVEKLTTDEAMEKASEWMERAAIVLKNKPNGSVPLFYR